MVWILVTKFVKKKFDNKKFEKILTKTRKYGSKWFTWFFRGIIFQQCYHDPKAKYKININIPSITSFKGVIVITINFDTPHKN